MSEFTPEQPTESESEASDRRQFLSKSAIMLALLALAQGSDVAEAASTEMIKFTGPAIIAPTDFHFLNLSLNNALKSGKTDPKSDAFLKLSPAVQKAFLALTPAELNTLRQAQSIFQQHFNPAQAGDNNGTIGM
jgi:hypothetical protein